MKINDVVAESQRRALEEGAEFGAYYYEQLAQQVFDQYPNLNNEDNILNFGYAMAKEQLGKRATGIFRDEDFPSDLVSAYFWLKKQKSGVAEGLTDTQKKIEDTILKLEQRLKFAKTPEQWDNIKDRIERLQAGLNRSKQGVAEGSLNEFAPDGFNGGDDGEGFDPDIAKMAQEDGFTKGVGLADGATLERAMKINHWHSQHGGMYKQYFAKGFKAGRMNKIRHDNKQYNLNLKLMKDGSIRHGEQGVAEGSSNDELNARPGMWRGDAKRMTSKGKPTQDELGMQDNLKNRIKSSNKKGGLTGPKGVLPEEQGVAEGSETNTFSDFHAWKEAVYARNADITQMGRAGQYTAIGSNGVIGKFDSNTNQGYINGQPGVSEDGVESWSGNPSDRRHPGHESYMTPEYMLAHYKKRLAQIAAGKHKYPKEVAQLQAKIAKLEKPGVAKGIGNK